VNLPHYDNFLDIAFSTPEKEHSQATQGADGSFFIVRVDSVTSQHARPLAEVRDRILTALKEKATGELLEKMAYDIGEKLRAGKKPDVTLTTIASGTIKRDTTATEDGKTPLPRKLVEELFTLQPHGFTNAYKSATGNYLLASLEKIIPAPEKADPQALKATSESLKSALQDEVMSHYLIYLRGKHPIWINQAAFRSREDEGNE